MISRQTILFAFQIPGSSAVGLQSQLRTKVYAPSTSPLGFLPGSLKCFEYKITLAKKLCWIITDGKAGSFAQAIGLAESCGFKTIVPKIFKAAFPFSLWPALAHYLPKIFLTKDSDALEDSWPDVAIGCGHGAIASLIHLKKASGGKIFCIYVLDPRISPKYFDLVVKMQHDAITGPNVIASPLSLNRVTKIKLIDEAKKFKSLFRDFTKPYYAVLIGGNTKRYNMTDEACADLISKVKSIIKYCEGSILITPSRRTPPLVAAALGRIARDHDGVYVANVHSADSNPYLAMLAVAEKIFVTNDSVNMISEACCAQKDTYIIPLLALNKSKSLVFVDELKRQGLVSMFGSDVTRKTKKNSFNNNEVIAQKVCAIMIERLKEKS